MRIRVSSFGRTTPHLVGILIACLVSTLSFGLANAAQVKIAKTALTGRVVAIDAGHGGIDLGASGPQGTREKDITLQSAYILKGLLEAEGARVVLTRTGDYLPGYRTQADWEKLTPLIRERTKAAASGGAEVLVSLHNDSNPNPAIRGTTTYYWGSPQLARPVQDNLVATLGSRNVGIKKYGFYILSLSRMSAILVEMGFLSNPEDEQLLATNWYQTQAAKGIRAGLRQYFASRPRR